MVTLPIQFIATKYPGYFWNVDDQVLYSLKVTGVLKPLCKTFPNHFNNYSEPGYRVSVKANRRFLSMTYLTQLESGDSVIPTYVQAD